MRLLGVGIAAGARAVPLPWGGLGVAAAPMPLRGRARWDWLLAEAGGGSADIVATCNGAADAPADWAASFGPGAVSASCASGMHALALARAWLNTRDEVVVAAVDILSEANHRNFESMRVLADRCRPWAPENEGFVLGEAAVVLRLGRGAGPLIAGPVCGDDLAALLATLPEQPVGVIAQGTGPEALDRAEWAAIRAVTSAPVRSCLPTHGHTLGVSGLLGIATAGEGPTLVVGRALTGACTAAMVGGARPWPQPVWRWGTPGEAPALHSPTLRALSHQAPVHRPAQPPAAIIVHFERPLPPPANAAIGGRLLPSAARELTPGFAAALLARRWGYRGMASARVGGMMVAKADAASTTVWIRGDGHVVWTD